MKRFAFYGRVSTDDNQNPEDSRVWQLSSANEVARREGGEIVLEYFDEAVSRHVPWSRRPQAAALLAAVKHGNGDFDGVVVGELQRAFSEVQAQDVIAVLNHYGVALCVPEFPNPINRADDMQMMMLMIYGYKSSGERRTIQKRVRTGQAALIQAGRRSFMGGRPPYGYEFEDNGPHPNPKKASDGKRLKKLVPKPATAPIVVRIFELFARGSSYGAIAQTLTDEGIPCPSKDDPQRNSHRSGLAWSKSSVRAILTNANYLGYLVWNKQSKHEVLVDPERPDLGERTKQSWNNKSDWISSPDRTHPALVDEDLWARAQDRIVAMNGGGRAVRRPKQEDRHYLFSGRLFCSICGRRMQAQTQSNGRVLYRCRGVDDYAHTDLHPRNVYVAEQGVAEGLDSWLAELLDPGRIDETCGLLLEHQAELDGGREARLGELRRELSRADAELERYRQLLLDGVDSKTVAGWISEAEAKRAVAQRALGEESRSRPAISRGTILEGVLAAGGLMTLVDDSDAGLRQSFYRALGVELRYHGLEHTVTAKQDLSRLWGYERVEGGT